MTPEGKVNGRYSKLESAKLAAERLELVKARHELHVGRNGHEVFDSPWGCYDLTVARQLAQQRGQPDLLTVKDWAEAARQHLVCTSQPDRPGSIVVLTTTRRGLTSSLVVDGYAKILHAHEQKVEQLECILLNADDSQLVQIS